MTLLEKIKNYKWFDSPNKLRVILEELYNSIGGGSGGGTQDLQSVLTEGNSTDIPIYIRDSDSISLMTSRLFTIADNRVGFADDNIQITKDYLYFRTNTVGGIDAGGQVKIIKGDFLDGSQVNLILPGKPTGNYTLATLDDIKKVDLSGRIYANNAAALTGGLTANDVYRTATGELRIVV